MQCTQGRLFGSSPRARGARYQTKVSRAMFGIIPACAGSAVPRSTSGRASSDHPRVRGERNSQIRDTANFLGSSPRARGALRLCGLGDLAGRIIPACAGSAQGIFAGGVAGLDHPRVRGERVVPRNITLAYKGSSLRARGARSGRRVRLGQVRIIPACAGSAPPPGRLTAPSPDHPRVRGERNFLNEASDDAAGSSPRARGAREPYMAWVQDQRIIPACAGSAGGGSAGPGLFRDHPRVRGERTARSPTRT